MCTGINRQRKRAANTIKCCPKSYEFIYGGDNGGGGGGGGGARAPSAPRIRRWVQIFQGFHFSCDTGQLNRMIEHLIT